MAKRSARKSARDWINAGFEALALGGIDAVKVERIASRLGVTKGSFYWHFDGQPALLASMLEAWENSGTLEVISMVNAHATDPVERLMRLGHITLGEGQHDAIEVGLRSWGAQDPAAAAVVHRVDTTRLNYVCELLVATGLDPQIAKLRAQVLYRVLIGDYMWRSHGGAALTSAMTEELMRMIIRRD